MEQMVHVSGWVDRLDEMAVGIVDQTLRETGLVSPPAVHVLLDGLDPPYVGYLTCRPMYRGQDAGQAVRAMGQWGSMLGAARLVVTFENADLCTALEVPGAEDAPTGLVVVDADRNGHMLRWHPAVFVQGANGAEGGVTARAEWGPAVRYPRGCPLPGPVADLLAAWRAPQDWPEVKLLQAFAGMEVGGYAIRWVQRRVGERGQPSWMRLLAPLM